MAKKVLELQLIVDDQGTPSIKSFSKKTTSTINSLSSKITKKLGGAFKSVAKTIGKVTLAAGKMGLAIGAAIGAATIGIVKKAVVEFANFEAAMANVSTLVDTARVSMSKLEKGILALPSELGSATELAAALYQTLSAGVKPAQAIEFITKAAKAAKAGLTDTFTAVDAGTTVLNAFGLQSEDAGRIFDQMFKTVELGKTTFNELASSIGKLAPIAAAAEISTEGMFAAIATLTAGGFKTSEAVSRMTTALGSIIKPSKEALDLSAELGLEFNSQALKAKGLAGFLDAVKVATGGNIDKMALLFGGMESLSVMLALTGKQADKFKENLIGISDSAGAVNTAFDKQKNTLIALWATFKNTIGKQFIFLGAQLAPKIKEILTLFGEWVKANRALIQSKLVEFAKEVVRWITALQSKVKSIMPFLKGLQTVVGAVAKAFNVVGKAIGTVAGMIDEFIRKSATIKAVVSFFTKSSPIKPWAIGMADMRQDLKELGSTLSATMDLSSAQGLIDSLRAGISKLQFSEFLAGGAARQGVAQIRPDFQLQADREREVVNLQLQLLKSIVRSTDPAQQRANAIFNINAVKAASNEEVARQVKVELDKITVRGA